MAKDKVNKIDLMRESGVILLSEEEIMELPFWKFCEGFLDLKMEIGDIARKNGTRGIVISIDDGSGKKITQRFKIYPGRYYFDGENSGIITLMTPGKFQANSRANFRSVRDWNYAIYKMVSLFLHSISSKYPESLEMREFVSLYPKIKKRTMYNQLSRFNYFRREIKNPKLRRKIIDYIRDCLNSGIDKSESTHLRGNPYLLWEFIEDEATALKLSKIVGCDMRKYPDLLRVLQIGEI